MTKLFQMKKVIPAVLLWAAPLLLTGEGTVSYRSAPGVPMGHSSTLQNLERFLNDLFPATFYKKKPLVIDITLPGSRLPLLSEEQFAVSSSALDTLSLEILSAAGGAMLHAHGKAEAKFRVPLFVCAAFRSRERSAKNEGRFLGGNRQLNSVKLVLSADTMPLLKEVLAGRLPAEGPAGFWFDDHARLLFELLRRSGFKGKAAEIEKAAAKLLESPLLQQDIARYYWNRFHPRPPQLIRRELDRLLEVQLPRLDHNGEESGLFETVSASLMAEKLRQHPRRQELFRNYKQRIAAHFFRVPQSMRDSLNAFRDSAAALENSSTPELELRFQQALAAVERSFHLCLRRSQALDEAALSLENPVQLLRRSFQENSRPGSAASPEAGLFLQRWNEYYNSN